MRTNDTNTRTSAIPYCYPSVLPMKSIRATFAETLPIRCDFTFTLWKDWNGKTPPNEAVFAAWNSLDAMICHRYLRLENDWRSSLHRPQWVVVLEQVSDGNKHLQGIVQCLPHIELDRYRRAFKEACCRCYRLRGFVTEVDPPRNENAWKMYLTKLQKPADQSDAFEFDIRFSPNFPCWKNAEI